MRSAFNAIHRCTLLDPVFAMPAWMMIVAMRGLAVDGSSTESAIEARLPVRRRGGQLT
jgi:hypothetical protein